LSVAGQGSKAAGPQRLFHFLLRFRLAAVAISVQRADRETSVMAIICSSKALASL
jgi:hypothetical protein